MNVLSWATAVTVVLLTIPLARAQQTGPATSAGPGRITCKSATTCEVGIGTPAKLKFLVNIGSLPAEDKDRLSRQCKPTGSAMCIVTIQGTEMGDPMKVKAAKITWYN
jgi:hypothetical protein